MTMSNPNNLGNGCSLEDCHTNIFELADLSGIKWRKLKCENSTAIDPLDDPVLQSFARCIQAEILCVWQRVKRSGSGEHTTPSNEQLNCSKELWIFWYGDREPAIMSFLVDSNLIEADAGSWEIGLGYECRTLLFKALHNLIERCLLSRNFVRIGKWFVQPFDHLPRSSVYDKSTHLSISFSFFLHGESTVCASVDVRQHPPLWRLHPYHLTAVHQFSQQTLPVVLAPYGLAGVLTGQTFKESDPATQKCLEEWKQYFVVPDPETWETHGGEGGTLPKVVEVVVAGVRMRYPSSYVLVHGDVEAEVIQQNGGPLPAMHGHPGSATGVGLHGNQQNSPLSVGALIKRATTGIPDQEHDPSVAGTGCADIAARALTKVTEDCSVTSGVHSAQTQTGNTSSGGGLSGGSGGSRSTTPNKEGPSSEEEIAANWPLAEPLQKNACSCVKSKAGRGRGTGDRVSPTGSHRHKEKTGNEKETRRRTVPFHRRNIANDQFVGREVDNLMMRYPAQAVGGYKVSAANGSQQSNDSSSTAGAIGSSSGDSSGQGTGQTTPAKPAAEPTELEKLIADSPVLAQPSPLLAHPLVPSPNHNATMPTLSPQPVVPKTEKAAIVDRPGHDGQTHLGKARGAGGAMGPDVVVMKSEVSANGTTMEGVLYKTESINTWLDVQKRQEILSLKRPTLAQQLYEEGTDKDMKPSALYEFDSLNQWLDYPLKRPRLEQNTLNTQSHEGPLGSVGMENCGGLTDADPYEFSDEASLGKVANNVTSSGGARSLRGSVKDENGRPLQNGVSDDDSAISFQGDCNAGVIYSESDLMKPMNQPPERLFDSDSDDDATPMGVETRLGNTDGGMTVLNEHGHAMVPGGLAADPDTAALAQVLPTPPTNERMSPNPSGMCSDGVGSGSGYTELASQHMGEIKCELEEPVTVSDYSFVYKPPVMATFISSTKYGPIELPSSSSVSPSNATAGGNAPTAQLTYIPHWQQFSGQPMAIQAKSGHGQYPAMDGSHPSAMPYTPQQQQQQQHARVGQGHMGSGSGSERMTSQETSPAMAGGPRSAQQLTPRTPLSNELLQSPQSNASSYAHNLNLKSVDNPANSVPEVSSVVVNIMLTDSLLNIFKDDNFSSCTFCVCNKNIRGGDVGLYLPDPNASDLQYACTCGFSAVVNRRLARNAGLFYEDEVDITHIRHDELELRKPSIATLLKMLQKPEGAKAEPQDAELVPPELLQLFQGQLTTVYPPLAVDQYCSILRSASSQVDRARGASNTLLQTLGPVNALARMDACEACYSALDVGRQAMDNCTMAKLDDPQLKKTCIHPWAFLNLAKLPSNSQETLRKLRRLLPLLEDAIQKKRTTRLWDRIRGPLSWKDFHLLSGRGADENSEPQPIPTVLVGHEKEWMSLTPHALQYWDKLLLEPYGRQRDIAYIVVTPDTDFVIDRVKTFFTELSQQYELCRLGRHRPIAKKLRDGLLRIHTTAAQSVADGSVDDWFKALGNHPLAAKMRLYAKVLKHRLAPFLSKPDTLERRDIFEDLNKRQNGSSMSSHGGSHPPPTTPGSQPTNLNQSRPSPGPPSSLSAPPRTPSGPDDEDSNRDDEQSPRSQTGSGSKNDEDEEMPSVVIYVVDPFTYGQDCGDVARVAMLGLLRCYQEFLKALPEALVQHVHLQVVPLSSIVEYRDQASRDSLRTLALSVYTLCRRLVTHTVFGRSLTGFGPAASAKDKVARSEPGKTSETRLYCPPYILAPTREDLVDTAVRDPGRVLFCGYCLSQDQRWLLGSVTDKRGEILETCTINIYIPMRNRRKKASARRIGLQKLWEFLLGIMSGSVHSWRLVIGRFGRLGHGELIGWAGLLSKKNLQRASRQLRDMCNMCSFALPDDLPCIQSACVISMEMHGSIFVMPDTLKMEERQSSRVPLTTPRDASVTHILVMPTSTTASVSGNEANKQQHDDQNDFGLEFDIPLDDEFNMEMGEFESMFDHPFEKPAGGTTSPDHTGHGGRFSPTHNRENTGSTSDPQDDHGNLANQPLAVGYYISTAPTGQLPLWVYGNCPHKQDLCPACFKAALHINLANVQQQEGTRNNSKHPLDSDATPDVLRYVLETYNALSWLSMDERTGDRRSCLPLHLNVLLQLYHSIQAFI